MIEALFYILKELSTKIRTFLGYKLLMFGLFHVQKNNSFDVVLASASVNY